MPTPTETLLINRINDLIGRAKEIQKAVTIHSIHRPPGMAIGANPRSYPAENCEVWRINFGAVVEAILSKSSTLWPRFEQVFTYNDQTYLIDEGIAFLIALREDISLGLLRRTEQRIEAAVTVDYIDMAERLFTEPGPDTHRHLAATVIAGAVFEHGLRALAQRHNLKVTADDGKPLMLNGLIDVVKKTNVVTELDAKSMRAWAGIRNAAAHGQFAEVTEAKAKELISGVTAFLASHQ